MQTETNTHNQPSGGALFMKRRLSAFRTDLSPQRGNSSVLMALVTREFNYRPISQRDRVRLRVMWRAHKCSDGRLPWQRRRRWNVNGVETQMEALRGMKKMTAGHISVWPDSQHASGYYIYIYMCN